MPLKRLLGAIVVLGLALTVGGCSPPAPTKTSGYHEYDCGPPVGKIIREDCSQIALKYDGVTVGGSLSVAGTGVSGNYREQATRDADSMIQMMKDRRVTVCHAFNTCKLSVAEYREEQHKIDDTFSSILRFKEQLPAMSQQEAGRALGELRGGHQTPPAPVASSHSPLEPTNEPTRSLPEEPPPSSEAPPPAAVPAPPLPTHEEILAFLGKAALAAAWPTARYVGHEVQGAVNLVPGRPVAHLIAAKVKVIGKSAWTGKLLWAIGEVRLSSGEDCAVTLSASWQDYGGAAIPPGTVHKLLLGKEQRLCLAR